MKLKEFEGKQLFRLSGIPISSGQLVKDIGDLDSVDFSIAKVAKVQTLQGSRGKNGGVRIVNSHGEAELFVKDFLGQEFNGELVSEILFDEKIEIVQEIYLGVMFDTNLCQPVLIVDSQGGVDIETSTTTNKLPIDYLQGFNDEIFQKLHSLIETNGDGDLIEKVIKIAKNLYHCFVEYDLKMVEINPLAIDSSGNLIAVDAVAVLDDDARYRWKKKCLEKGVDFPERTGTRKATAREVAAREIDREDYRGVAGKTFLDLDGDIAILTIGGGASMTIMDTLTRLGGKPANFTEYSGNPPREKVERLTRIVLDKEGLSGLLIAGVIANFTNIYETLQGTMDVLVEQKPDFPIVIRRAGPHDVEAKEMLMKMKEEHGLDIHYYDENLALSKVAEIMVKLSGEYKENKGRGVLQ